MKYKNLMKATILLANFAVMADLVIIPAAGSIFAEYQNAGDSLRSMFLTGPFLFCILGSLFSGFLGRYLSKKTLLISSYLIFIAAAYGGALIPDIYYMVIMRQIVGFAYGIILAANMGLIAEVFSDEKERSTMMGFSTAATSVWGIILAVISGYLAVINWHLSYQVYLAAVPIVVMIFFFIPKTAPERVYSADNSEEKKMRFPFSVFIPVFIAFLFLNIFYNILQYYIAFYLEEVNVGDASTAGIMSSLMTAGGFVFSVTFSLIYMRMKRATPIIFFFLMAATYIVLSFPSNVVIIGAACFFCGAAYGLGISYYYMHTSVIVPPGLISAAMGIIGAAMSLGGFLSSYILNLYKVILSEDSILQALLLIGASLCIAGSLSMIHAIRAKPKRGSRQMEPS